MCSHHRIIERNAKVVMHELHRNLMFNHAVPSAHVIPFQIGLIRITWGS